jgi:SSS family solute:Na+ symporter
VAVWSVFWHVVAVMLPLFFAVVTCVWFTWGGLRDFKNLIRRLKAAKVNHLDDGTVVNHQNLDEVIEKPDPVEKKPEPVPALSVD